MDSDFDPSPLSPVWVDSTGSLLPGELLLPIKVSSNEAFNFNTCQV